MNAEHPIAEPDATLLPPRYVPERPLPPYRYVPGLLPHPAADPQGHSYGHPEPEVPHFEPQFWAQDREYLYGVDLFNHRYYWEAHEAWERVWHTCDKARTQGLFVQGLIQLSAALLKWHVGSARGLQLLFEGARAKIEPARRDSPGRYLGIALATWWPEVEGCYARLLVTAAPDASVYLPVIVLEPTPVTPPPVA
jgi:hypothetical protein